MKATDYGLDPEQFLRHVIRPTLPRIGLDSPAAQVIVLGTSLVESNLRWLDQLDAGGKPGPAYGLFGMEKLTHDDLWLTFLPGRVGLQISIGRIANFTALGRKPDVTELWTNLAYATAMCRARIFRAQPPLPAADDALGHALYHKQFYNTPLGKTVVSESVKHFEFAVRLVANSK